MDVMADHLAPVYAQWPIDVVDASGVHLHTRDGRRILDLYGGHAVAALGYSHPRWLAALEKQARSLLFQSNAVPLGVRSRAAMRLSHFAGLGLNTVFFVSTGAEANENALKLALRITGRRKVVAVEGSFHGRTAAAGAVTGGAAKKWYGFPQTPFEYELGALYTGQPQLLSVLCNGTFDRFPGATVVLSGFGAAWLPQAWLADLATETSMLVRGLMQAFVQQLAIRSLIAGGVWFIVAWGMILLAALQKSRPVTSLQYRS
jgi:hypothetical protein